MVGCQFPYGNEVIFPKEKAQRMVRGFADADAGGDLDIRGEKAVIADPEAGLGRSKIATVVSGASNAEGLRQTSGAGGKFRQIADIQNCDTPSVCHFLHAH
jgi:hypothetical protein